MASAEKQARRAAKRAAKADKRALKQAKRAAKALRKFNKKEYGSEYAPLSLREPNYVNAPLGGYAQLQPTYTSATGFKRREDGPNKPLGGGREIMPDFQQELRISARPDLQGFTPGPQLAVGPTEAPVQRVTNRPINQPNSRALAATLRAIEGPN